MIAILMLSLAVIGIVVAAIGTLLAFRHRNRLRLAHVNEDCIPLFRSIVQSIDGLEISYRKKTIDPTLILLKGGFVNNGNIDIDKASIHEPVCIKLPEHWRWLQAKITGSSRHVKGKCKIRDESNLEFKWDLLKSGEFLSFNALIKSPRVDKIEKDAKAADDLLERISFSQRITNLRRIKTEKLSGVGKKSLRGLVFYLIPFLPLLVLGVVALLSTYSYHPSELRFLVEGPDIEASEVLITAQKNGLVAIKRLDGTLLDEVKSAELFSKYKFSRSMIDLGRTTDWFLVIYGLSFIFFGGVATTSRYFKWRKEKRLLQILRSKG